MQTFDTISPGEKNVLTFNFVPGLTSGNTLQANPTVEVTTILGVDPDPTAILNGAPEVDSSNTKVLVPIAPNVDFTRYKILVTALTVSPVIELKLAGVLPVDSEG